MRTGESIDGERIFEIREVDSGSLPILTQRSDSAFSIEQKDETMLNTSLKANEFKSQFTAFWTRLRKLDAANARSDKRWEFLEEYERSQSPSMAAGSSSSMSDSAAQSLNATPIQRSARPASLFKSQRNKSAAP